VKTVGRTPWRELYELMNSVLQPGTSAVAPATGRPGSVLLMPTAAFAAASICSGVIPSGVWSFRSVSSAGLICACTGAGTVTACVWTPGEPERST
jgi:hypothetical protein